MPLLSSMLLPSASLVCCEVRPSSTEGRSPIRHFGWIGNDQTSQLSSQQQRCGCSACCGSNDFNIDSQNFQKAATNNNNLAPQANTGAYFIDALLPPQAMRWSGSTVSYSFMASVTKLRNCIYQGSFSKYSCHFSNGQGFCIAALMTS